MDTPTTDLALLLSGPEEANENVYLVKALRYDGLAVAGICPLEEDLVTKDRILRTILQLIDVLATDLRAVHILSLPNSPLHVPDLSQEIIRKHPGVEVSCINVETEGGCRIYFEEVVGLNETQTPPNPELDSMEAPPVDGLGDLQDPFPSVPNHVLQPHPHAIGHQPPGVEEADFLRLILLRLTAPGSTVIIGDGAHQ